MGFGGFVWVFMIFEVGVYLVFKVECVFFVWIGVVVVFFDNYYFNYR